ncbi:MAG: sulfatase-like hydrolase/transferase [Fluviicola sp.]|nr:sulfatase-like hydrolase/transferase [Fluviicola sp.]
MWRPLRDVLLLILFWIICFDVNRILFSINYWSKFSKVGFGEWLLSFVYSFRLDLATACALSALPFVIRLVAHYSNWKWTHRIFRILLTTLLVIVVLVQSGEIIVYGEWNHKLSSRVFVHLSNPVEVVRTASYSMTFWFFFFAIIEFVLGWWLAKKFFKRLTVPTYQFSWKHLVVFPVQLTVGLASFFLLLRGGWQQIPINIGAAVYTDKPIANDLSINSLYFFGKSYLLYKRSNIDEFLPNKVDHQLADKKVKEWYKYPKEHDQYFLKNKRPNVVFIVLEGWSAEAIGCLGPTKGATPNFDHIAEKGLLFTDIYSASTTSEIGNSSIFSGVPAVPEVSISMQPDKNRKLNSINQDLELWGYHTSYIFSGDLKYGNIDGYLMDHGFDVVKDENEFPSDLPRGKLNFYDRDLYRFLIKEINSHKKPFLQCAFTGSTHSPYDQPKGKGKHFSGEQADFMNSLVYADECLGEFIRKCKKYDWYKNTLFVIVADHGHASPTLTDPGVAKFYHIPLLFFGEPIKESYRGKRMNVVGSQADIAATLIYQMKGDASRYPWSKDLMNPKVPQFAFYSIIRGYGWVTPKGNFTWSFDQQRITENTFTPEDSKRELNNCNWFLSAIYEDYKQL